MQAQYAQISSQDAFDNQRVSSDTTANNINQNIVTAEEATIYALSFVYDGLELAAAILATVKDVISLPVGPEEAIPAGPEAAAPEITASDIMGLVVDGLTIARIP